ncbi:MAG: hypothetical protein HY685_06565 [Chloroflexi bacterium]|nr:hypothetical protein [Chloroflexota bacterium]
MAARRRPGKELRDFYANSLAEAEREILEQAREVEGIDEEIALLRTRLRQALEERPDDLDLLLKGMRLLVQAVSARYRLSGKAKEDLMDNLVGVIQGIGEQVYPEAFRDVPEA